MKSRQKIKHIMKTKLFTLCLALFAATNLFAYDCKIDGIYYNLYYNNTAEVTNEAGGFGAESYSGSVVIPSSITYNSKTYSVTTIGGFAFYGCTDLTSVTIPNSVTTIEGYAFCECSGLISITIPNSVTTIGDRAFSSVNNIVYSGTATGSPWGARCVNGYVDGYLVYSDASKTHLVCCSTAATGEITLPNSVTTIGEKAFYDCSGLISVAIPNSVTTIGGYAFGGVLNITYNGTATGSPWGARYVNGYVDGYLVYSDSSKTQLVCCSTAAAGEITLPNSVTTIGQGAFIYCSGLTSVTIPNSVTTIGTTAFANSGLESVHISSSVTSLGQSAFSGCQNLHTIYMEDGPTSIGFICGGCSSLVNVRLPNTLQTIGYGSFYECNSLQNIIIPNSVTYIGMAAFAGCKKLEVIIPNSVTEIATSAFRDCLGLTSIDIPSSVTTIGDGAFGNVLNINYTGTATGAPWGAKCINGYFDGCLIYSDATKTNLCACLPTAIGNIQLPNSVITIGDYAFNECNIQSITIPENVTSIGLRAFYQCNNLTTVYWNAKNSTISDNSIFYGIQENITTFILGNKVEVIPDGLCSGMSKVKEMIVPFSVKAIGSRAFNSVKTITIPNSIDSLGNEWLGWHPGKEKTIYVAISPFEYNNNPESLDAINPIIKDASYQATIIPQLAEVATWATTPTTIEMDIDLTNIPTTHLYDSISIDYFGEENDIENILTPSTLNHVIFTGLTPNQKANIYYTSKKIGEDDWEEGAKLEIQLPKLTFTTLVPKVVSAGTAVVAAETNISDYETNVGFEWRKYDAPESMPSKSGAAILYNGMMEGKLLNLGTDAYWNVRPYYEAADGTRYYGEWITFDPSDFSYFEPTVHTYALATSPTANNVQVRGYVMTGTDDVTEQGFEYWFKGGQKAPHRVPTATADSVYRVTASGQVMTAVLEDLAYSSTYTCRAYAIAGGKTYYGEEVQFLTPEDARPIYTLTVLAGENGSVNAEVSGQYREGEKITLKATPNEGYLFDQWSDGSTENPYIFTIMQNIEITATFKQAESGLTNLHSDIKATKYFHNGNLIIERNGQHYSAMGERIR